MNHFKRSLLILAATLQFGATGLAADFTVINTNNIGPGSLRQAILNANVLPGPDRIVFNIPTSGVHVIEVEDERLPPITDPITIDGYTQPGASANTLAVGDNAVILIQLRKDPFDFIPDGLVLDAGGCVIRGLSITGFGFGRPNSYFGGGITVAGTGGNTIEGNFIGMTPDGRTRWANVVGVRVYSAGNLIGGSTPAARNVISGNTESGIYLVGDNIYNTVSGNYVGTDATGSRAVGNGTGVWFSDDGGQPNNILGGTAAGTGNVISGNDIGVGLGNGSNPFGLHTTRNIIVQGNLIGTAANGVDALGNSSAGVYIFGIGNLIGGADASAGNTIAFNRVGVALIGDRGYVSNRILSNRIYANSTLGIDLENQGLTPNDPGDPDLGPNNLQNFPLITSSSSSGGTATIQGTLNSTPNTQFTLQFFADSQSLTRAGQTYLGSESVTTDGNGNASFSVSLPNDDDNVIFNATATDADGNTSEFARNSARLLNVSARLRVQTGDNALLAGLIGSRNSFTFPILRALGPSLAAFGIGDPLPDPTLALYDESGAQTAFNDNWKDDQFEAASIQSRGLAPPNDLESAMFASIPQGSATAIVRGKGNETGVGLLELYDLNAALTNFSVRGLVETGENVMIAGFIIDGGVEPVRLAVRAIGPSLTAFGITNPLLDPVLELHDSHGQIIDSNDDWKTRQQAELETVGLAPSNNAESAILTRLAPGAYTAILRGKGNATGVALLEYYNLP